MVVFNFKQYFNETVPVSAFDNIRNRLQGTSRELQPNTFGIEIEFKYDDEYEDHDDYDMDAAWQDFQDNGPEAPQSVEDWEEDNPEPEKPVWNDEDMVANYYSARMFDETAKIGKTAKIFKDFTGYINDNYELKSMWDEFYRSMRRLLNDVTGGTYFIWRNAQLPTPENEEKWQENKIKRKEYLRKFWQVIEEKDPDIKHHTNLRKQSFEFMELIDQFHDNEIQNLTEEDWQIRVDDFFYQEYEEWDSERTSIESERDNWENGGESEAFENWFQYRAERYRERGSIKDKMYEVQRDMKRIGINANLSSRGGGGKGWNIFEDESGVIEISSDILTISDFPLVRKFLNLVRNTAGDDSLTNDTGAHVHVGTPAQTDAFDLVAIVWMLDEETILQYAGREDEDIESYANRKNDFFNNLYRQMFEKINRNSVIMTNNEFWQHLSTNFNRYYGVNAIQAFRKQRTVELRFLSSQIIQEPERFLKFIQYFMALPQLAQKKKELRIRTDSYEYRIIRQLGNKVQIVKDMNTRVRQANVPVAQLKTPEIPSDPANRKQDLMSKYGTLIRKQKEQR